MNEETSELVTPPLLPLSTWQRFLYGAFVVIAPFVDFSFVKPLSPDWQSGRFSDYIALFLSKEASLFFFLLLAYSVICYILFLVDENHYGANFLTRLGIYTGMLLALQYTILAFLAFNTSYISAIVFVLACISPFLLKRIYRWFIGIWSAALFRNIVIGVVVVISIIAGIVMKNIFSPFFLLFLIIGVTAPFWSLLISGQAALWLLKHHEGKFTLLRGLGGVAWLSAYVFAMRFNILKMYELYAALPTEPPNCYIATAAAQGHPRIVCSQTVRLSNGRQVQVNRQLQRLKCVELALMAAFPQLHKLIRRIYDVIGRQLAFYIKNPILADVAYLLLVPVEWLSFPMLKLFVPDIDTFSKKIYRS